MLARISNSIPELVVINTMKHLESLVRYAGIDSAAVGRICGTSRRLQTVGAGLKRSQWLEGLERVCSTCGRTNLLLCYDLKTEDVIRISSYSWVGRQVDQRPHNGRGFLV
jgi:hypothetical protein